LRDDDRLVVTFVGLDDTYSQTVHARCEYGADDVKWGQRFVDIMGADEQGRRTIDLRKFHDTTAARPGDKS
jgi:inward rectifier potassium channel